MEILSMYNNKMVSSVLIPTYDSKGAFYMSRTNGGIERFDAGRERPI